MAAGYFGKAKADSGIRGKQASMKCCGHENLIGGDGIHVASTEATESVSKTKRRERTIAALFVSI
jgi:hypothetical protein